MTASMPYNHCVQTLSLEPDVVAEGIFLLKEQAAVMGCESPWFYKGEQLGSMFIYWDVSDSDPCAGFTRIVL